MNMRIVARLINLPENRGVRVETAAHPLLLVRSGGQVRAFQADCPHAGAPLEEGVICQGRIVCPWHKATFAVANGAVLEPPALVALKQYPVQVRDGVVSVGDAPVDPAPTVVVDDSRCFAVIGAGAAGTAAVATLRREGFTGRLLWIDRESAPAYDRTALSKFVIAGQMAPQDTPPLLEDAPFDTLGIQGEVQRLDAVAKRIELADGRHFDYDAALVATGGQPQSLDIPGAVLSNVFVLRSREDAARIDAAAESAACAVIIGDSFIGLEAASALRQRGLVVQVVSRHDVPLAAQLGRRIGAALRQLHEDNGVIFHGNTEPVSLDGHGAVGTVLLKNGKRLAADLVVIGTGVTPATGFIEGVSKAEDQSLLADHHLRAAPGLWAAGDNLTFPWNHQPTRIEHWRLAQQLGVLAARNMLGAAQAYADVPFFWTYHFGKTFEVLGHGQHWNRLHIEGDLQRHHFIALLCHDDQVEAVVACEYPQAMARLSQRMQSPLNKAEALGLIHEG
ncbi:FAD-dependent oxidoreductase [Pseudomonas synxantha]|uniref:FAD-dependent oxidoreductase n=1 Tax=Pseudomonas synxantha TaxID=47883 RepID=A0ABS0UM59_9PSED|nr:FAD-dependent oxidoreductase [Pseudomonas synxantha]MBI6566682.1 FAD-dependent oxidoreductase [Pseudomonas synxantha]MBI6579759.1 FAD-dependent oxidoreductase [Pseudomonas synxantha]MBI6642835.1 FAD-dependent oxidoreductase [Pseudomonas synxantha]